jgi:esterase/lipase superfamily enzyme
VAVNVERYSLGLGRLQAALAVLRYGRRGAPLVYVPSSAGDEGELERYGFDEECAASIEAGRLQLFAIDGFGPRSLFDDALAPAARIDRYARFEQGLVEELLPWVGELAGGALPGIVGASYGAFVAANLLFKNPRAVRLACGLGGVYGMWHRLDGHHDEQVYRHTPLEYLPQMEEGEGLAALRASGGMVLFGAADDPWLPSTRQLELVLRERAIPYEVEIDPPPADHHERWWRQQLGRFLERHY